MQVLLVTWQIATSSPSPELARIPDIWLDNTYDTALWHPSLFYSL